MTSYHPERLLDEIERGSQGGPGFYTTIIGSPGGNEQRNQNWEFDIEEWDIRYGIRKAYQLQTVVDHYLGRRGMAFSFPFRNWSDYKSGPLNDDVPTYIADGDGVTTDFQVVKTYPDNTNPYAKPIWKPVTADFVAYVADVVTAVTHGADGIISFAVAPADGAIITALFEYDIPVRYVNDRLLQQLQFVHVKSLPAIKVRGVIPPLY